MTAKLGVITGASGGIGQACAKKFAAEGWSLLLVDLNDMVQAVAKGIEPRPGATIAAVTADITLEHDVERVRAAAIATRLPVRLLGLVAGINQAAAAVETIEMADWDRVMNINLRANVLMMKAFIPALREAGGASIVTVSSYWGRAGHGFFSAYCASKAALISLTQCAAAELAPAIRVNSLAPGNVATPMHFNALRDEAAKRGIPESEMRAIEWAKIPLARPADPAEMAAGVYFLASQEGSYLTGATIDVNGGCGFY